MKDELTKLKNKGMSIQSKIDHLRDELMGLEVELEQIDEQIEKLESDGK